MGKVLIVLLLLIAAVSISYSLLNPPKDEEAHSLVPHEVSAGASDQVDSSRQEVESTQDLKLQKMQARYADLKELRKKIKMRISRLSSRLRRSEFPPEQARTISLDMRRANYLLKNPKLLGAFSDVQEIENEIDQLSDVNVKLDEIKRLLDEKRKNKS